MSSYLIRKVELAVVNKPNRKSRLRQEARLHKHRLGLLLYFIQEICQSLFINDSSSPHAVLLSRPEKRAESGG